MKTEVTYADTNSLKVGDVVWQRKDRMPYAVAYLYELPPKAIRREFEKFVVTAVTDYGVGVRPTLWAKIKRWLKS